MHKRTWWLIASLLIVVAMVLASCGGGDVADEPAAPDQDTSETTGGDDMDEPEDDELGQQEPEGDVEGDTIVWARYGDSDTIDPQKATSTLSWQVYDQVYDTLLAFDKDGNVVPNIAKDWEVSEDGTEITFYLQDDAILCHDGNEFTAEDVKFTALRAIDPATGDPTRSAWGPIADVEVIDAKTAKFVFESPFGPFVSFMADPFASMICQSGVETHGDQFGNNPVGTGPWKFVSWTKGDEIVLERNDDYTNYGRPVENPGPPHAQFLIVKTIPEPQTRLAAVETGAVHFAEPPLEEVDRLLEDDSFRFHIASNTGQNQFLEFTVSRPPFDEQWAREAVAYAIDIPAMLDIVFGELVEYERCAVARGVLGNDQEWCEANGSPSTWYDPDMAVEILAEHGYGPDNPLTVTFMSYTGGNREKTLQVLQQQLAQVNIEAEIEMMDIGTLNARVKTENNTFEGQGSLDSMGWAWFDPDILYQLFHCPGWVDGFCSPELDVLLEETRTITDPEAREAKVKEVQQFIFDNVGMIPMYTPAWEWIYVSKVDNVDGFVYGPFNRPLFNDVQLP